MKLEKTIYIIFCALCFLQGKAQTAYKPVSAFSEIEIDTTTVSFNEQEQFQNDATGNKVSVLHSLENTGFQFYNSLSFKNEKEGVIAGGTQLRLRTTQDGGKHWKSYSFSRFANAFYSTTLYNNQFFVVGASRYIFRNSNLNKEWEAFDVASLAKNKYGLRYPKFYKIKFSSSGLGFIIGSNSGKPILLKTTNKGKNWQLLNPKGLKPEDKALSDLFILSDSTVRMVTFNGNIYESTNEGKDWSLLYTGKKGESLNSIAFKNRKEGYVAGLQSLLLKTTNGGKTWEQLNTKTLKRKVNISNLAYTKQNQLLFTTAESFQNKKDNAPIFSIDKEGNITPFLFSKKKTFTSDAYGLFLLKETVFLLDRDKLYKTSL